MSYQWGSSYYDSVGDSSGTWRATNHAYAQHEQYNPVYPSLNGTADFFSSSAQNYDPAPYQPSKKPGGGKFQKRGGKKTWKTPNFHLIHLGGPNKVEQKPTAAKIQEPAAAPRQPVKVARGNNNSPSKTRGGSVRGGVHKMPNYRPNQWDNQQGFQRPFRGRGRGRGGRFSGPPRPANSKDDIQFVHLPDEAPAIQLNVSPDNIVAFHGFDSVFTTQHSFPVLIDGRIYTSCDHYYQIRKLTDLTGVASERLLSSVRDEQGKPIVVVAEAEKEKKAHSAVAKEVLKAAEISKEKVDEWRNTKGLEAIQKALHAKVRQSAHLREALKESAEHILVHAYPRDSIYGTGCTVPHIKRWLENLSKAGVKNLKIPATFPLNETTVQHCPVLAQGRNILGVILMQLREKLRNEEIAVVDMSSIYNALRVNDTAEPMETQQSAGFATDLKAVGTF